MTRVVVTCGDVNGIGPEIAVKAFKKIFKSKNTKQIITKIAGSAEKRELWMN